MASAKKKVTATRVRKLRDLKAKTNPKGGASTPQANVATVNVVKKTDWIELESFSFGAGNP
jgi:hypothetical protein